jgi:hypothetical protein
MNIPLNTINELNRNAQVALQAAEEALARAKKALITAQQQASLTEALYQEALLEYTVAKLANK